MPARDRSASVAPLPAAWSSHLDTLVCDTAVAVIALVTAVLHILTAKGYGFFRDELYYLASAEHLDWGYVEHPPLVAVAAWIASRVLGGSIYAVRFLPALAAGATVYLTGAIARQLGGRRFAQSLAALAAALAPAYVGLFSILSMNAFDVLLWTAAVLVVIRILKTRDQRLWIVFGLIAGVGLETKISMLFLGFGIVVGLVLSRDWESLSSGWFWIGGVVSVLLLLPYLWWQQSHGWPLLEFIENTTTRKNLPMSPAPFLAEQALQMNPLTLPLWLAGLGYCLFERPYRALGWAYLGVLLVMVTQNTKPYYLAPAYPMLFAAGSIALENLAARRGWAWSGPLAFTLVVGTGLLVAPIAKPLLPVDSYVRYSAALGIQPRTEERQELGRLPQYFADMHGWPELAAAVADVFGRLPPEEKSQACVFGQNYGEAGAIDFLGKAYGLPPAISGHNSYFFWGPRDCTGEILIVIGDRRERLEVLFEEVNEEGKFTCKDCMPYENNRTIWVCRRLRLPLPELWPQLKRFI